MRLDKILIHIAVICSVVGVITKIIDWYNPYMDFSGCTDIFQIVLYAVVFALPFTYHQRRKGRIKK